MEIDEHFEVTVTTQIKKQLTSSPAYISIKMAAGQDPGEWLRVSKHVEDLDCFMVAVGSCSGNLRSRALLFPRLFSGSNLECRENPGDQIVTRPHYFRIISFQIGVMFKEFRRENTGSENNGNFLGKFSICNVDVPTMHTM